MEAYRKRKKKSHRQSISLTMVGVIELPNTLGTLTKITSRSIIIKVPNIKRFEQQEVALHE